MYAKEHPGTFFSAPSAKQYKILTTCHPKFLLNETYRNEHTPICAKRSDVVYTIVCAYLGDQVECTLASNIIEKVLRSGGFKILRRAAQERNKRNGAPVQKDEDWNAQLPSGSKDKT